MSTPKTSPKRRNGDLAMIHIAAKRLFGDVSRGGDGREDYEGWLETHTGKRSAGKLTVKERTHLIKTLRRDGLVPERARGGIGQMASGEERPTPAQWNKLGGLARTMGWSQGLEDPSFRDFIERTAKVNSARFISRSQASKVILGLEAWALQRAAADAEDANAVS
ncbi:MAG: phage protein GemA/Gp16 family protein [Pseudomonadota bacterium]